MKLDNKLDEILDLFADGDAFRVVARKMNVSTRTLHKFLSLPENHDLYKGVLQESSDSYASLAEEVLANSPADRIEIQRARELAHHYRWMAAKRNPRRYGDKLDVDHSSTDGTMTPTTIIFSSGSGADSGSGSESGSDE